MMDKSKVSCRACGKATDKIFIGQLLDKQVAYYDCPHCGYVQTEAPYWLDRAYSEAINVSDTGIMVRNQVNSRVVLATLMVLGKLDGRVVDYAGGYGILVRLLRDSGVNALWMDGYCENLLARGFERTAELVDMVTAFEAFEHFVNPAEELDKMLEIAPNILLSTDIIADPAPRPNDWWYYGGNHGQHIGFFRIRTLEKFAKDRGKFLLSNGASYHLLTDRPINPILWKMVCRFSRLLPLLMRRSLTTSDSETLVNRRDE